MNAIIEASDLKKSYNDIVAVDSVSFTVQEGEIFGFLGPNGAGKSTTINMLTTYLRMSGGKVRIAGYDLAEQQDEVRSVIGVVPQELTVDEYLTGFENMQLQADIYGVPRSESKTKILNLLRMVDLEGSADLMVRTYSGGMRRRLELAEGLINDPRVLFLDEPTVGLDIQTRTAIWSYIGKLRKERQLTVFLTTHYLEEADEQCDRVAIIDHGKIVVIGSPSALKNEIGGDVVVISCISDVDISKTIAEIDGVREVKKDKEWYRIKVGRGEKAIPRIMATIADLGVTISSVSLTKPSLDDVFLEYTGKRIRDAEEANANDKSAPGIKARNGE